VIFTVTFCFLLGIANFALHSAVLHSGHEFIEDTKQYFGTHFGKSASYVLEFAVLLAALVFSYSGSILAVIVYAVYTGLNGFAAWLLLSGRA